VGLRFDPIGGGQFKQAVKQLIEAESQPIKNLEARKAKEDSRLKLFQDFKGRFTGISKALDELSTFRKFRELKVDLGDGTNLISVTLDKERAEPGQYELEIEELALRTSAISCGFEDANDPILGLGFITMNLPNGDDLEIYVEDKDSSLKGIAALINKNPDSPVRASVIKDASDSETPWRLLLSGKKDGMDQQIDFPDFYFLDANVDFYLEDDREAQNASVYVDGFPIETESNDVADFLPGVNLHLKQARAGQPFTMTITEDYQKISGKVKALVEQLNQVLQFIVKQNTVDDKSDTSTTFAGDISLQSMEYQLRNTIHQAFSGGLKEDEDPIPIFLNQIGIEFDKTGQISFKEEKFNKAMEGDFDHIAEAITGPTGFANTLRRLFDTYTRTANGFLGIKEQGLRNRIKQIDDQIDQKTRMLDQKKQQITDKFARLEATMGNLQRQQQYLSAALPGAGGGNPIAQLLGGM
jgi:flagellar hook-associated protein 2